MKPLELIAYPLDMSFPRGYVLPRDTRVTFRAAERMAREKRLTNAELAAEYWKQEPVPDRVMECMGVSDPAHDEALEKVAILHRFATLPHYDEVT